MSGALHDRGSVTRTARHCMAQISALSDELDRLRERVSSHPHDIAMLERRLADARSRRPHDRRQQRAARRDAARGPRPDRLPEDRGRPARPAAGQLRGLPGGSAEEHTADIYTSGRKMRVSVSPDVDLEALDPGQRGDDQRGA